MKKLLIFILTLESRLIICRYKPFIVAVTGSVGKTSTKDAIYCVLKDQSAYVRKSEKSMNGEIGLPLTIIGVGNAWYSVSGWLKNIIAGLRLIIWRREYPDCLVLEIGADHPGDIQKVVKWLHPDIAVITKVSSTPVHVEFFKSPEQVFIEKASLAKGIKTGGTVILFADDEKVMSITELVKEKNAKIISYGTSEKAEVRGIDYHISYINTQHELNGETGSETPDMGSKVPTGFSFNLSMEGMSSLIAAEKVVGKVFMYPLLAAVAVGKAKNLTLDAMSMPLSEYVAPHGRMNIIEGINGSTVIDDTYNSSPDAVESALDTLNDIECTGLKIAILGDMMELGKYSAEEHRKIGRQVAKVANILITAGQRSRTTAEEAVLSGLPITSIFSFDTSTEAGDFAKSIVKSGDVILVKGSQSARMERVTKALLRHPEKSSELLVRQDREWLEKK